MGLGVWGAMGLGGLELVHVCGAWFGSIWAVLFPLYNVS